MTPTIGTLPEPSCMYISQLRLCDTPHDATFVSELLLGCFIYIYIYISVRIHIHIYIYIVCVYNYAIASRPTPGRYVNGRHHTTKQRGGRKEVGKRQHKSKVVYIKATSGG